MFGPVVKGGVDFSYPKQFIYLENTFVCTEHNQAFMEVDNIRIVYDLELECIIGWYNHNVGVENG